MLGAEAPERLFFLVDQRAYIYMCDTQSIHSLN